MSKHLTIEKAFGQVLREERNKSGFSQEQLGLTAGLDRTYISLLERGLRQPSLKTVFILAKELGTEPDKMIASVKKLNS